MKKVSWEEWITNVHHLLMIEHNFTDSQAEDLLFGDWTDAFYDMWKEGYSYKQGVNAATDENQPWNQNK